MTAIQPIHYSGHHWVDRIRPENRVLTGRAYLITKRTLELGLVVVTAPVWLAVMLVIALAIKLDSPGAPVMYTMLRTGKGGRRFKLHKFRTMVPNADAMKEQLQHLNELEWPDFKITNDPRVTRVGRVLRKTSLDELPQLFDVLLGNLSLVGPRPTGFASDTYRLWQTERLDVTPGMTGLWQLYGRATTVFDDRSRLDIAYVQRRCLWLDLQILIRTIPAVVMQRGAK